MTIHDTLHEMQTELKAPKGQFNSFGKYKYRSCEDVVEAVKKILRQGVSLTMSDEIQLHGNHLYVIATAKLSNSTGESIEVQGCAREAIDKKGMDAAQMTGTASSYARKYALNGLFAIDDTKDSDSNENREQTNKAIEAEKEALKKERRDKAEAFIKDYMSKLMNVKEARELENLQVDESKSIASINKGYPDLAKKLTTANEAKYEEVNQNKE